MEYRLIIQGDHGAGKSALTIQFQENRFISENEPTIEDRHNNAIVIDDETCILHILDTDNTEYPAHRDALLRIGQTFVFVYSIASRFSFEEINTFIEQTVKVKDSDKIPMILVGNKSDLEEERQVTTVEGQDLAKLLECPFFETSSFRVQRFFPSVFYL